MYWIFRNIFKIPHSIYTTMYLGLLKPTKRWFCTSESCWLFEGKFPASSVINEGAGALFIFFCLSICVLSKRKQSPYSHTFPQYNKYSCYSQGSELQTTVPLSHMQPSNSNISVDESTLRKIQGGG